MPAKKALLTEKPRSRVFRDPIHGDIFAGPLQSSIVDTTVFQRLRFIRQNGLLHLVFPGAVHTRFAHSLGTMHLAQRAFAVLFPGYSPRQSDFTKSKALSYIGTVFETAALLHDIGHCAFSHSIERVRLQGGEPFFPPLATLVKEWSKKDAPRLSGWWSSRTKSGEYTPPDETKHEDLGLLMVGVLFGGYYSHVSDICKALLKVDPEGFGDDVRALLVSGKLSPSDLFLDYAEQITKSIPDASRMDGKKRAEALLVSLHTLLSGTLDVDRLDYLVRDSHYTGTIYGICDVEILVNGLCLAVSREPEVDLVLALRSRATRALDDFLWSRYQLFSQVLNHKTNVILNALLAEAVPEMIEAANIFVKQPKAFIDFVEFTDDLVLSSVIRACLRSVQGDKTYDRALVHRVLPLHLKKLDLSGKPEHDKERIEEEKGRLAQQYLRSESKVSEIRTWSVKSTLIKGGMPYVLEYDKGKRRDVLKPPGTPEIYQIQDWTKAGKLPVEVESCHFFVDRDSIPK